MVLKKKIWCIFTQNIHYALELISNNLVLLSNYIVAFLTFALYVKGHTRRCSVSQNGKCSIAFFLSKVLPSIETTIQNRCVSLNFRSATTIRRMVQDGRIHVKEGNKFVSTWLISFKDKTDTAQNRREAFCEPATFMTIPKDVPCALLISLS